MKIGEIAKILNAEVLTGENLLEEEVLSACASDLMSDVLAGATDRHVLLTGLVNAQAIRTAEMLDIRAVVFTRGKRPTEDIISLASKRNIAILSTDYYMFKSSGLLYINGLNNEGN